MMKGLLFAWIVFLLIGISTIGYLGYVGTTALYQHFSKAKTTTKAVSTKNVIHATDETDLNKQINNILQERMEEAYFEGQRDYMEGDIRIAVDADSIFYWTKSPWDVGKQPIWYPSLNHKIQE